MTTISLPTFTASDDWEQLPPGYIHRDVSDVAVDSHDNVYILTRSDARVLVYDSKGGFLKSWGEGILSAKPHGITVDSHDYVYCADQGDHTVRKFTTDGVQVAVIGTSGVPSDTGVDFRIVDRMERQASIRGGPPFNNPTKVAIGPNGDIYVADGYGNARVHRFSAEGELLGSWGSPGTGPGQFRIPHSVCVTSDERVLVADRENSRVQVFSLTGELIDMWIDLQRPVSIAVDAVGFVFVGEAPLRTENVSSSGGDSDGRLPSRLSILDSRGSVVARLGAGGDPCKAGNFMALHGVAIDSHGDVYLAEVTESGMRTRGLPYDPNCHSVQKFIRK